MLCLANWSAKERLSRPRSAPADGSPGVWHRVKSPRTAEDTHVLCIVHCIQACSLLNRGMERGRWNWGLNKQVLLQKFWLTQNPSFMCKDAFVHKVGLVLFFWGLFFAGFWLVRWLIYFFSQARDLALCKSGNCNSSHLWYVPTQLILVPSL